MKSTNNLERFTRLIAYTLAKKMNTAISNFQSSWKAGY